MVRFSNGKKNREVVFKESKRQTKERRDEGKNMIRPFTFDEKRLLWSGLYNNGYYKANELQEEIQNAKTNN